MLRSEEFMLRNEGFMLRSEEFMLHSWKPKGQGLNLRSSNLKR